MSHQPFSSLNVANVLPQLMEAGVTALKIEGRQRGRAYVSQVVSSFRRIVDAAAAGREVDTSDLAFLTEGGRETSGAYRKEW